MKQQRKVSGTDKTIKVKQSGFPVSKKGDHVNRFAFEHYRKPLISRREFLSRQFRYLIFSLVILIISIGIGTGGYHFFGDLAWLDSFLNAAMILTGMGPVDRLVTDEGKLFAAFYALFSGVAFLTFVAVLFAPMFHRFLHRFHLDIDRDGKQAD